MSKPHFSDLGLSEPLCAAVGAAGYQHPTAIQTAVIPAALTGRDLIATAQTGTGKTAAFALPLLQRLAGGFGGRPNEPAAARRGSPRALILTPTRELAQQIEASLRTYGCNLRLRTAVVVGGIQQDPQVKALRQGIDILVATPGRLGDLVAQGHVVFDRIEVFVLDEADRMLDMGFIHAVRHLAGLLPRQRQTLFFSATMSPPIVRLAGDLAQDPQFVAVAPPASISDAIDQRVFFVAKANKSALLSEILAGRDVIRALVFARTRHGADRLAKQLSRAGLDADAIHADKSQAARQRVLAAFSRGRLRILIATDIVARGIDVQGISHVINYELPAEPESYVHRIGRTARAEAHGVALAFCDVEELSLLRGIERLTRQPLHIVADHRHHAASTAACFMRQREALRQQSRHSGLRSYRGGSRRANAR